MPNAPRARRVKEIGLMASARPRVAPMASVTSADHAMANEPDVPKWAHVMEPNATAAPAKGAVQTEIAAKRVALVRVILAMVDLVKDAVRKALARMEIAVKSGLAMVVPVKVIAPKGIVLVPTHVPSAARISGPINRAASARHPVGISAAPVVIVAVRQSIATFGDLVAP